MHLQSGDCAPTHLKGRLGGSKVLARRGQHGLQRDGLRLQREDIRSVIRCGRIGACGDSAAATATARPSLALRLGYTPRGSRRLAKDEGKYIRSCTSVKVLAVVEVRLQVVALVQVNIVVVCAIQPRGGLLLLSSSQKSTAAAHSVGGRMIRADQICKSAVCRHQGRKRRHPADRWAEVCIGPQAARTTDSPQSRYESHLCPIRDPGYVIYGGGHTEKHP